VQYGDMAAVGFGNIEPMKHGGGFPQPMQHQMNQPMDEAMAIGEHSPTKLLPSPVRQILKVSGSQLPHRPKTRFPKPDKVKT